MSSKRVVRTSEEIDALLAEVEQELAAAGESVDVEEGLPEEELVEPMLADGTMDEEDRPAPRQPGLGAIEIKDLANELDAEPKAIRKWLRKMGKDKPTGGRWAWDEADPTLAEIRAAFNKGATA
jgi:hypothetical protein